MENSSANEKAPDTFRAGYVNIIGKPNVGKSTLMNILVGEKLSIITSKAQTTRHRILGVLNGENFQIIYSDTPGIIKPEYELHKAMMRFVKIAMEDADVILFVTELGEKYDDEDPILQRLKSAEAPIILILNKIDLAKGSQVEDKITYWKEKINAVEFIPISALDNKNIEQVFEAIIKHLPLHPPYFPTDTFTDKPERFFASEIVREKIFLNYKQEIPYSTEVIITEFKEDEKIIRIRAEILVERDSQKGIIIGKGGESLKTVGIQSRQDMEKFFGKQVHLEQHVKVVSDWRKKQNLLDRFGYTS